MVATPKTGEITPFQISQKDIIATSTKIIIKAVLSDLLSSSIISCLKS